MSRLVALPFVCLLLAAPAAAHSGSWYITQGAAERVTLRAFKGYYPSVPMSVQCFGAGGSLAPRENTGRFYQHHKCMVEADFPRTTRRWKATVHVINKTYVLLTEGWGAKGRDLGTYRR